MNPRPKQNTRFCDVMSQLFTPKAIDFMSNCCTDWFLLPSNNVARLPTSLVLLLLLLLPFWTAKNIAAPAAAAKAARAPRASSWQRFGRLREQPPPPPYPPP